MKVGRFQVRGTSKGSHTYFLGDDTAFKTEKGGSSSSHLAAKSRQKMRSKGW